MERKVADNQPKKDGVFLRATDAVLRSLIVNMNRWGVNFFDAEQLDMTRDANEKSRERMARVKEFARAAGRKTVDWLSLPNSAFREKYTFLGVYPREHSCAPQDETGEKSE